MTPYLLDANFFIEAHRKNYPMDVFPSFWEKIKVMAEAGKIISLDKVKEELYRNEDDLKTWCEENLPESFFKPADEAIAEYKKVAAWAYSKRDNPYSQSALDVFLDADEADAWLVAYAMKNELPLVTSEVSAPESKKSIKIPDSCTPFGIRTIQPVVMFREMGEKI